MTPEDHALVAALCAEHAGLSFDAEKPYLIESRLAPVARREGFASTAELAAALRGTPDPTLAAAVVEAMAPADTCFFRDPAIFERLWREQIPHLARRRPDGMVRIWSAGCAAGQEIYSLAMLQADEPAPTGRVELFASDYAERLLERARSGTYSSFEVQRGLPARRLVRHFENRGEHFQLTRGLRQSVRWRKVNLLEDLTAFGQFDIVLCRYVLNGLTAAARARVLQQLSRVVAPDGLLVLGKAEAAEAATGFEPVPRVEGVLRRAVGGGGLERVRAEPQTADSSDAL
jgi:chemotaxis protein methyltransferase CheR